MLLVPVSWLYVVEVLRVLDSLHEERSEGLAGAMGMVRPEDIVPADELSWVSKVAPYTSTIGMLA